MDFKERMAKFTSEVEAKKKEFEIEAKEALSIEFKSLFEQNPTLESFQWEQYTDYWNDGDECIFGVYKDLDYIYVNDFEGYDEVYEKVEVDILERNRLRKVIQDTLCLIPDYIYKEIFGDHVQVRVDKNGITTKNYTDHN